MDATPQIQEKDFPVPDQAMIEDIILQWIELMDEEARKYFIIRLVNRFTLPF
ncbi:hypothetical protein LCGC14_1119750 [marine sediment metagenome]|uniref:Uncharacterized protein n=1 Tax=marine sediment metagenome TaxID=412755 RepID=A0A0F9M958_9ZZZZ